MGDSQSHSHVLAAGEGSTFYLFIYLFLLSAGVGQHLPAFTFSGCDFGGFFSSHFPAALQKAKRRCYSHQPPSTCIIYLSSFVTLL